MRKLLTAALLPLAAAGAFAVSTPALAASQSPPTPGSNPFNMAFTNDSQLRWQSNGTGNQVTVSRSGADYMTVNAVHEGSGGGTITEQYQNGNGKCMYVNGSEQLLVSAGACDSSRTDQRFYVYVGPSGTGYELESVRYVRDFIMTYGNTSGFKVWVKNGDPLPAGAWHNFTAIQR